MPAMTGFYSDCVCAIFAPTTSCIYFADFATSEDPPITLCPDEWAGVGTGIVTLTGDITCTNPAITFVTGPNDLFNGCGAEDYGGASSPGNVCCSTICDQTC